MDYLLIIRHAVPSDAPDIHAILQKSFREYAEQIGVSELDALKETASDIAYAIHNNIV